ncbi:MAG: SIMPL domain-containing protein [Elainellaceae cyanobacterium]
MMLQNQLAQIADKLIPVRRSLLLAPAALLIVGLTMQPACAQETLSRVLSVTGRGSEAAPTSATRVSVGVQVDAPTAEAAQSEAAQRSTEVVERLQSEQVDKLETAGITLNPRYDYSDNRRRLAGYTATNTVSFEVETERAGELLDDLVQAGATDINGISFIASDAAIATAQQQALQEAVQDAQGQAAAVLEALGFTSQEIIGIQVNGASTPPPVPFPVERAESLAANDAASTPIVGQEQQVNASVTLQVRY